MDALFIALAQAIGASIDQIKLISCLLFAYPLGSAFVRIPSERPDLKHAFSIAISILFFFPILKIYSAYAQLIASVLGTYYLAKLNHSSRMPWIVFAFVMGHLTVNHVIRALSGLSYETVEVTGPQMVLTMKLTTFAWNVWDGRRPAEELDKWQLAKRVSKYPSLLEFLGYAFYFPGVLVGPYLDYAEYMELVHEIGFQDPKIKEKAKPGRKLPQGRKRVAYRKMVMGLLYLGTYVVIGGTYNLSTPLKPWFMEKNFIQRLFLFQLFGPLERAKYYAIWTLTEGASILTGLGFTGYSASGKSTWEGAANVKVWEIEFPSNFKTLLDSWNMKTNIWLRECIYKRVTPKGQKPGFLSTTLTFLTSALWHGIAGGYYLTFLLGGFITSAARLARANFRPLLLPAQGQYPSPAKRAYDLAGTILSVCILNYVACPFMVGTFEGSFIVWSRLGWYGHIVIGGGLLFFHLGGNTYFKKLQVKKGLLPQKPRVNEVVDVQAKIL